MIVAMTRDIGKWLLAKFCKIGTTVDSEVNGDWIDRLTLGRLFLSAKLVLTYSATLASGETLTVAANIQDASSTDGTGVADYGTAYAAAVVATGESGGSTETGVVELDVDLSGADNAIRSQQTFTTSSTGTCTWCATLVFGGPDEVPAS